MGRPEHRSDGFIRSNPFPFDFKTSYWLAVITLLPIALTSFIWLEVVRGVASRAIDGSGHYAVAQIYDRSIFPDTFGWTNAYFAGMPFPNFYPPLFFWCVSLLSHTHLISFATAFKLVVAVPLVLMPIAFWAIAWVHGGRDRRLALSTAVACATLYTMGEIFQPNTGLDMSSTLLDGFYTQPLGFFLLLFWILVYLLPRQKTWQFILATVLLALTVLTNFFNAVTAILFIASVLGWDVVKLIRARDADVRRQLRQTFLLHLLSPLLALGLTAFWVVPMVSTYQYLVTRPLIRPLSQLVTTPTWAWYALAAIGFAIWVRRPFRRLGPYLTACALLLAALIFSGSFAPTWFPLQVFRFFSTSNFLLSLPVGISIAYLARLYLSKIRRPAPAPNSGSKRMRILVSVFTFLALTALAYAMSTKKLTQARAFYTAQDIGRIGPALDFARAHNDGAYLVEVLPSKAPKGLVRSDSLALNAYLGAQGNRTVSIVYREASPNSSFFNAQLNAFSTYRENFGISSALLDDLDFINQPLAQHIERLRFLGVRYVVAGSQEIKDRLAREPGFGKRHEAGDWSIFEVGDGVLPPVRALNFRPALVVSDFTVKLRTQNQYDFVRLAEEQFNDAWFDVLLVRSPERRIDRLTNLDKFGALIIDRYDVDDEEQAFVRLTEFANTRPLILLSSEAPLFKRIQSSLAKFPNGVVIERPVEPPGKIIDAGEPTNHYNSSSIRAVWKSIRAVLEQKKIPVTAPALESSSNSNSISRKTFVNRGAARAGIVGPDISSQMDSRGRRAALRRDAVFHGDLYRSRDTFALPARSVRSHRRRIICDDPLRYGFVSYPGWTTAQTPDLTFS